MADSVALTGLVRASRRSGVVMLLGAGLVLGALGLSASELVRTRERLAATRDSLAFLSIQNAALAAESAARTRELGLLRESQGVAVMADSAAAERYLALARSQCALGRWEEARVALDTAFKLNPGLRGALERDREFRRVCGRVYPPSP